ncbi:MAG: nuclear transport factor 2 family protein [Pseudonocardiaceae bacterium]|nr:nuclear transport factor 2 family protein [Pseudonocardiaceae bacterium]
MTISETESATGDGQLVETVRRLVERVDRLESTLEVRNLQHQYGYYLDKCLYEEVADLFAENSQVLFMGGIYRGKAGVRRLYCERFRRGFTDGRNGPMPGFLLDHMQAQDVVHVEDGGERARARFRTFMQAGTHRSVPKEERRAHFDQWWEGGLYENVYVREGGIWKIEKLDYRPFWHATFEDGWANTPDYFQKLVASKTYPEDEFGPDELLDPPHKLWPVTDVLPFHYPHPVTGKPWGE